MYVKLGKLVGKSQVGYHFVGFLEGRNYARGIGDAWYPQKQKRVIATITKQIQKLAKK